MIICFYQDDIKLSMASSRRLIIHPYFKAFDLRHKIHVYTSNFKYI